MSRGSIIPFKRIGEEFFTQITNNRVICNARHCNDIATCWLRPKLVNGLNAPVPLCAGHWIGEAESQVRMQIRDALISHVVDDAEARDDAVDSVIYIILDIMSSCGDITADDVEAEERALEERRRRYKKRRKITDMLSEK